MCSQYKNTRHVVGMHLRKYQYLTELTDILLYFSQKYTYNYLSLTSPLITIENFIILQFSYWLSFLECLLFSLVPVSILPVGAFVLNLRKSRQISFSVLMNTLCT